VMSFLNPRRHTIGLTNPPSVPTKMMQEPLLFKDPSCGNHTRDARIPQSTLVEPARVFV
jgi:hypothetical protein